MKISKGDKTCEIPNWALLIGLLVVDNLATNVCKTISCVTSNKNDKKS